ncbi:zinc finger protein 836-like [Mytilus trossulus]|uniref:zinc finger protein 836-like n=1 Tax=Mytilus trossulus TaxID=6551 RepID=UPI003004720C
MESDSLIPLEDPKSDIYKEVHIEMMTTGNSSTEVDMAGALNASAALSASAALKITESTSEHSTAHKTPQELDSMVTKSRDETTNGEGEHLLDFVCKDDSAQDINIDSVNHGNTESLTSSITMETGNTEISNNTDSIIPDTLKENHDLSPLENLENVTTSEALKQTQISASLDIEMSENETPSMSITPMADQIRPETFIDGIEKFVNFVSKEGLAKKMNDSVSPVSKERNDLAKDTISDDTSPTGKSTLGASKEKTVATSSSSIDNIKTEKQDIEEEEEDDVDADLKSYALAVNDMLDSEVEVSANSNELDSEIQTVVVSNTDAGQLTMTFTDNAVGRFETIGKSEDKVAGDPLAEGLKPLRKSHRPKRRRVYEDFEQTDTSAIDYVVEQVSKAIEEDQEFMKMSAPSTSKSKRKNPSPRKAKLTVEEVYESDTNEDSDGDLNKDILKVRMAKCDICNKHFLDKKKLEEHRRRHNRERKTQLDYPCVVCGKVFLKREHWRRHVKIHDDVRPYSCTDCDKTFRRKEHVKRHMLIHSGEKPFECMYCHQFYQRADHLKKHVQQHMKGTYQERRRKGNEEETTPERTSKRRKPTTKAAKLVAQSRRNKHKQEDEEEEQHYSDGLSDDEMYTA